MVFSLERGRLLSAAIIDVTMRSTVVTTRRSISSGDHYEQFSAY